jgi:hypothetical protein
MAVTIKIENTQRKIPVLKEPTKALFCVQRNQNKEGDFTEMR